MVVLPRGEHQEKGGGEDRQKGRSPAGIPGRDLAWGPGGGQGRIWLSPKRKRRTSRSPSHRGCCLGQASPRALAAWE